MYHYVRDLRRSRYPAIKGRDIQEFRQQLRFIQKNHTVVSIEDFVAAQRDYRDTGTWNLPKNALILTFDDGYSDHYDYVFPLLDELGMRAGFFPPANAILHRKLLNVNKIHLILACQPDNTATVQEIFRGLDAHRSEFSLATNQEYYARYASPSRFDSGDVAFIKRVLQKALPQPARQLLVDALFAKFVSSDEGALAEEMYMTQDQLRCLVRRGMCVGSHGYSHSWMSELSPQEQRSECESSLAFLTDLGVRRQDWIMCYPYGDSNESLRSIIADLGCAAAFTTQPVLADASSDPLLIPRIDTNDLPVA